MGLSIRNTAAKKFWQSFAIMVVFAFLAQPTYSFITSRTVFALPDVVAPTVPSGGAPHSVYEKTNNFHFTWNTSIDDQPGLVRYEFRSSQDSTQVGSAEQTSAWKSDILTSPTLNFTNAHDGMWYWQVRAIDTAGNKSAWSGVWNMTIDTVKPELDISQPGNNELFGGSDKRFITVKATVSDENGLETYHIDLDEKAQSVMKEGNSARSQAQASSVSVTIYTIFDSYQISAGLHTIHVSVTDKAGNISTEARTVIVDKEAPQVNVTAPTGVIGGDTLKILGSITDNHSLREYYYQLYDSDKNVIAGTDTLTQNDANDGVLGTWDIAGYLSGNYYMHIWAKDQVGNSTPPFEVGITIDHTPPVATLGITSSTTPTASTPVSLEGSVTDYKTVKLMLDGDELVDLTPSIDSKGNWRYVIREGLIQGDHIFSIVATDQYGNISNLETSPLSRAELSVGPFVVPLNGTIAPNITDGLNDPFIVQADLNVVPSVLEDTDKQADTDVLGMQTKEDPDFNQNVKMAAITATEGGWSLFGMLWYWWMTGVVLVLAVLWWVTALTKRRLAADVL